MKAVKPIKRKEIKMKVVLPVIEFKARKNVKATVDPNKVLMVETMEQLDALKNEVLNTVEGKSDVLVYSKEIFEVLSSQDFEKDAEGRIRKDPQSGRFLTKAFSIIEQRRINRILDLIEEADTEGKFDCEISIEMKPDDINYLSDRIKFFYENFMVGTSKARLELYDYFLDLKTKAANNVAS